MPAVSFNSCVFVPRPDSMSDIVGARLLGSLLLGAMALAGTVS